MLKYLEDVKTNPKANFDPVMAMQVSSAGFGMSASQQYDKRLQALTKPEAYAKERKNAYEKMTEEVDNSFNAALNKYISVGMPADLARQYALQAAANEGQIQQQLMEIEFPSGANLIEEDRAISKANIKQYIGAPTRPPTRARRRAVPRKKRAPRRKR